MTATASSPVPSFARSTPLPGDASHRGCSTPQAGGGQRTCGGWRERKLAYRESEEFCPAPVHPGPAGHMVIANAVVDALTE